MKTDTHHKLAPLTIALHWIIGVSILAMLAVGVYMHELPKSPLKDTLYFLHKSSGLLLFFLILARIAWRGKNGLLKPAAPHKDWEVRLAKYTHISLLTLSLLMPISGMIMSLSFGSTLPLFGLLEIGPVGKYPPLAWTALYTHQIGALALLLLIALHAGAALKHHFADKDYTLKRMLGAEIPRR